MKDYRKIIESKRYSFSDTSFDKLMQKRIYKVLLICNPYDSFMLEEDGRIDEKIFNEYYALNLRYPPMFLQANTIRDAYRIMEEDSIDLIITMLTVESVIAFKLARDVKNKYPNKPIVVLTPFSREVSLMLENEDVSAIDYVFCWLGNTDILLAIIKLIEDRMNLKHDVEEAGVQVILLVEDSIRYYSSYLPNIYKIVFQQSKRSMTEGVNEHQRMMVMRGRPKILLATNYEQAVVLYNRYKDNLIGVVSDISFKREGIKDTQAGVRLCKVIREEDPYMPFLLQSSDIENAAVARELNVGFLNKYSKSLSIELRNYIITQMAFGDFIFRNPDNMQEICRATDLRSLQEKVLKVPNNCLEYHITNNHFSKWMNARALFSIARMLKYITFDDFKNIDEVRSFIYDVIDTYRKYRGKGVIAKFEGKSFDEYYNFSRVGEGSVGGKARGLAFIDTLIKKHHLADKYPGVNISIPRTVVLSTDVFDEFMENNNLYRIALSQAPDEEILNAFVDARLPSHVWQELYALISIVSKPIAIRSSSKLEDSHYQPFAGVYSTYMIPCIKSDPKFGIKLLTEAIKSVYASVFFKSSKAYMMATANVIDEEKMGIILQEVCGTQDGNYFYPTISGVARSINFYPIPPQTPGDGIVNLAYGLGKYIVNGGQTLMFSPRYPQNALQLSTPEMAMRDAQKKFFALDMNPDNFVPSVDDGINIASLDIKTIAEKKSSRLLLSTYDYQNHMLRDGIYEEGLKVLTFAGVLRHKAMPLSEILDELMTLTQKEIGNPVEIEFAVNLDVPKGEPVQFSYLQMRPIVENKELVELDIDDINTEELIILSKSSLGNGVINNVCDLVYVRPEKFNPSQTNSIAVMIEEINQQMIREDRNYILVGPGRWGSSDPWLGIPVKWSQISNARVIVESGLQNFRIDPSQGTHFFQNLTSFRVGYFTINPFIHDGFYDTAFLDSQPPVFENEYLRHIRFARPVLVMIDGKKNTGIIKKPV
jgi:hypothetical protein